MLFYTFLKHHFWGVGGVGVGGIGVGSDGGGGGCHGGGVGGKAGVLHIKPSSSYPSTSSAPYIRADSSP